MKKLKSIWYFFRNFFKRRKREKIYKKLATVAEKKQKDRLVLRYDVVQFIRKYAKLDKDNKSLYIPLDHKTKELVRYNVEQEFGQEMRKLNVRLNHKLQVI